MDNAERVKVSNGSEELAHDNGGLGLLVLLARHDAFKELASCHTREGNMSL